MSGLQKSRPARAVIEQYNTLGLCISYAQKVHRLPLKLNSPALKDVDAQPHSEQQNAKISQARPRKIFTYAIMKYFIKESITTYIKLDVFKGSF